MIDENLVKPFIEQYDFVREYIAEKERIVIGTMGPEARRQSICVIVLAEQQYMISGYFLILKRC